MIINFFLPACVVVVVVVVVLIVVVVVVVSVKEQFLDGHHNLSKENSDLKNNHLKK